MSSFAEILVSVARYILIYGGLIMIFFGILGSTMIIIIFSRRPLCQNPCSIYIITNGILSLLFLLLCYLPNIVTFGFQINWLALNTLFCKFEMSYAAFTVTSVYLINCFISFDRYVIFSQSIRVRSFSSKRVARLLVPIGLVLVWCAIGIPAAVLFENIPTDTNGTYICSSQSRIFLIIAALIYFPILESVLPIVLVIFFWYLMRKNIRSLNNQNYMRRFDKEISRMYFFQILANAIASFPFAAINLYRSLTMEAVRSADEENIVQFIRVLSIWAYYIQYCSDFYIYMGTSAEVREQTRRILCFRC